jgi:hypothetical protein
MERGSQPSPEQQGSGLAEALKYLPEIVTTPESVRRFRLGDRFTINERLFAYRARAGYLLIKKSAMSLPRGDYKVEHIGPGALNYPDKNGKTCIGTTGDRFSFTIIRQVGGAGVSYGWLDPFTL